MADLAQGFRGQDVDGTLAHGDTDAGNPVKVGGRAIAAEITALTAGQRSDFLTDLVGKQITMPYANPENFISGTGNATGTTNTAVIAAIGAGVRIYVTTLIVHNSSTTNTRATIKSATTTLLEIPAPARGGSIIHFPVPLRLTANEALNFASGASVTTMYVSAVGYKGV